MTTSKGLRPVHPETVEKFAESLKRPFVRTPYNYDMNKASRESGLATGEGKTHQSFKDESDINTIVRRFGVTGQLPQVTAPRYGDFSEVVDFRTAMDVVVAAEREFMKLPGSLRKRFGNDPQQLLEFVGNDKNRAEAEFLGIIPKPAEVIEKKEEKKD